jgi:hypothetical protein
MKRRLLTARLRNLLLAVWVILTTLPSVYANLTDGLIGYWKLDEGDGAVFADSSANGLAGDVKEAQWIPGKFGMALLFDNSHYSLIPYREPLNRVSQQLTAAAWVKPSAAPQSNFALIFDRPSSSQSVFENWALQIKSGIWSASVTVAEEKTKYRFLKGPPIQPELWTHLAMTYDGTTITLYVNGARVSQVTVNDGPITYSENRDLVVGANINMGTKIVDSFKGAVDELRLYERALSADEIAELFRYEPASPSTEKVK